MSLGPHSKLFYPLSRTVAQKVLKEQVNDAQVLFRSVTTLFKKANSLATYPEYSKHTAEILQAYVCYSTVHNSRVTESALEPLNE